MRHAKNGVLLFVGLCFSISSVSLAAKTDFSKVQSNQQIEEALSNPYAKYYSAKDIEEVALNPNRRVAKGQMIVVDTRDEYSCRKVQTQLEKERNLQPAGANLSDLCRLDPKYPYASVVIMRDADEGEFRKDISFGKLTSDERNIFTATRNLGVAGIGAAGILYMLPESVSKWDHKKLKGNLGSKWKDNVKDGPVWDDDDFAINYIGHPVAGAAYYQVARNLELSPMQSFGYSVIMSTFFWEYGVESFAETPSIQDLIITPIIGSLMGELFYRLEKSIQENRGEVWGSRTLGKVVMVLLNPAGALSDQINRIFGSKVIKDSKSRLIMRPFDPFPASNRIDRGRVMIGIEVEFAI
jgi:hypothetical protein